MLETIVKIKFGSHLYGTSTPESDLDIKAVYIPDASDILLQRINPVAAQHRLKQHGEKNTSSDTDFEAYSLQRYLELLAEGQTVALDMLFAPDSAMLEQPHRLWREIQSLSPQLMTRGATAFVRYCRQQANKYGIKGSRVAAARAALGCLIEAEATYGTSARLAEAENMMQGIIERNDFLGFVIVEQANGEKTKCFDICGKKAMLTSSIQNARMIAQHLVDEYGQRALAAERNEGLDWKALSHAVRVGHEAIELFRTGRITFPRPEAKHLLAIKQGRLPYTQIAEEIEALLSEVDNAADKSNLPDKCDPQLIDGFVQRVYGQQVVKEFVK